MPIRFLLIGGAFLLSMLMWIDRACISAAKDNIATDLQFDDTQMGWVMSAFALGYALLQVPGGKAADRFGPRIVMAIVCILWSTFTILTGVVRGFVPMVGTRFLFGAGEAAGYPTITRALYSWLPVQERGITNSLIFSGGRLGAAIAMPGVVWLIATLGGWQQAFYCLGAVGVVASVAWFWLFRNLPEQHFLVNQPERDYILANRQQAATPTETDSVGTIPIGKIWGSPVMWMLMVQYVAHNVTFFFVVSWFFPFLKSTYELTDAQTAWYASVPLLCGVVGNWISGATVDGLYRAGHWNLSRRLPAMIGFICAAVGMFTCVNMETPFYAVAAMSLAIFGADMVLSPSWSTCQDIGGNSAGAVSGSMNMVGNLGSFFTALAFPYLAAWTGNEHMFFYFAAGLNVVAIVLWIFIKPDRPLAGEANPPEPTA